MVLGVIQYVVILSCVSFVLFCLPELRIVDVLPLHRNTHSVLIVGNRKVKTCLKYQSGNKKP